MKDTYTKFNIRREEIDALIFEGWTLNEGGCDATSKIKAARLPDLTSLFGNVSESKSDLRLGRIISKLTTSL